MADQKRTGRELKRAREDAGIEQEEAARRLGVHPMTLSRYERGVRPVPAGLLAAADTLYGSRLAAHPAPAGQQAERPGVAGPQNPDTAGLHAPSYWRGRMEASALAATAVRGLADTIERLAVSLENDVRGILRSGLLTDPNADPSATLVPDPSPELYARMRELLLAEIRAAQEQDAAAGAPPPPNAAPPTGQSQAGGGKG